MTASSGFDPGAASTLAERLRFQARECGRLGSRPYADLLGRAAMDIEVGGPAWELLRGHEHDPFGSALALRMMGAVHRLALLGRLPELARLYADPTADADSTWAVFREALATETALLRELLERPVQTNEVGRGAALLPGFLAVAGGTGLPLRLLELGASAGLNLRWDRYRYLAGNFEWGPADSLLRVEFSLGGARRPPGPAEVTVVERRGCDPAPLDPASEEDRLTLRSYLWPGQPARAERLEAALEIAAGIPVALDRAPAADWLDERLREAPAGVATVVFHSLVVQYLEPRERERVTAQIRTAGERATVARPLAWLRMEPAGGMADVRLSIWPGGEERLVARAGYHGDPVELSVE